MQDLTLVGVHDDGEHLVLVGPDGHRYRVPVDEPLRAAVRRDRARLGQLQIEQAGTLRPRDIQALIRAGHTAEDVAADAGVPVEHVRRYEGPVLAEREFVARQARAVRVRRGNPGVPGSYPTLDELVTQRLAAREVDAAAVVWDAWRTEGTWHIRLAFSAGGRERHADWTYDVQLRHVTPQDDEARWLLDEQPVETAVPGRRALAPVRDGRARPDGPPGREHVYDVEADGGVRSVEDERASAAAATVDLLDTLRERRGRRQWLPDPDEESETPDALEMAVDQLRVRAEALGEPPAAHPPRSRPAQLEDAEVLALPESPAPRAPQQPAQARPAQAHQPAPPVQTHQTAQPAQAHQPAQPQQATSGRPQVPSAPAPSPSAPERAVGERAERAERPVSAPAAPRPAPPRSHPPVPDPLDLDAAADRDRDRGASRRARRASVPSWDDIVFGSRRD